MSAARRLLFGTGGEAGAALVTYDGGGLDGEAQYVGLARSNRIAIAGIGGEVAFYTLYLAVVIDHDVSLDVTPIVDDLRLTTQTFPLAVVTPGTRVRSVVEVPVTIQLPDSIPNYEALGEWAPRGMWFQVEITTAFEGSAGYVQIDGVEIEHEIIREGRQEGQAP